MADSDAILNGPTAVLAEHRAPRAAATPKTSTAVRAVARRSRSASPNPNRGGGGATPTLLWYTARRSVGGDWIVWSTTTADPTGTTAPVSVIAGSVSRAAAP